MIYQNIKKIAGEKRISIRKIEQEAEITPSSIYHWNEVKPSVDKVAKVAKVLEVSIEELLEEKSIGKEIYERSHSSKF